MAPVTSEFLLSAVHSLASRDFNAGTSSTYPAESETGLSGTAIALVVCVGVVPAIGVLVLAVWLLLFYSYGRSCCCCRRSKNKEEAVDPDVDELRRRERWQQGRFSTDARMASRSRSMSMPQPPPKTRESTFSSTSRMTSDDTIVQAEVEPKQVV